MSVSAESKKDNYDKKKIKSLLENNNFYPNNEKQHPFALACSQNNLTLVNFFLENYDFFELGRYNNSITYFCHRLSVSLGMVECLKALSSHEGYVYAYQDDLERAVLYDKMNVLEYLLKETNPNAIKIDFALTRAVMQNNMEAVKLICDNYDCKDTNGKAAKNAVTENYMDIFEFLLPISSEESRSIAILYTACWYGRLDALNMLLPYGIKMNGQNLAGVVFSQNIKAIRLALDHCDDNIDISNAMHLEANKDVCDPSS